MRDCGQRGKRASCSLWKKQRTQAAAELERGEATELGCDGSRGEGLTRATWRGSSRRAAGGQREQGLAARQGEAAHVLSMATRGLDRGAGLTRRPGTARRAASRARGEAEEARVAGARGRGLWRQAAARRPWRRCCGSTSMACRRTGRQQGSSWRDDEEGEQRGCRQGRTGDDAHDEDVTITMGFLIQREREMRYIEKGNGGRRGHDGGSPGTVWPERLATRRRRGAPWQGAPRTGELRDARLQARGFCSREAA